VHVAAVSVSEISYEYEEEMEEDYEEKNQNLGGEYESEPPSSVRTSQSLLRRVTADGGPDGSPTAGTPHTLHRPPTPLNPNGRNAPH
jgi:hypothetical protein